MFANYSFDDVKRASFYRNFVVYYSNLKASTTYSTDLLRYDFDKGLLEPITIQTSHGKAIKYFTQSTNPTTTNNLKICINPTTMRCSGSVVFPKQYTSEFLSAIVTSLKQSQADLAKREKLLLARINALDSILETNPEYFL